MNYIEYIPYEILCHIFSMSSDKNYFIVEKLPSTCKKWEQILTNINKTIYFYDLIDFSDFSDLNDNNLLKYRYDEIVEYQLLYDKYNKIISYLLKYTKVVPTTYTCNKLNKYDLLYLFVNSYRSYIWQYMPSIKWETLCNDYNRYITLYTARYHLQPLCDKNRAAANILINLIDENCLGRKYHPCTIQIWLSDYIHKCISFNYIDFIIMLKWCPLTLYALRVLIINKFPYKLLAKYVNVPILKWQYDEAYYDKRDNSYYYYEEPRQLIIDTILDQYHKELNRKDIIPDYGTIYDAINYFRSL